MTELTKLCKECFPAGSLAWTLKTKPRPAPYPGPRCATHWREKKKAVKAANHEKRVQNTYGLEAGEYARLYTFQGGLCALCRRATGASRRLSVDHDHATGEVRGLLCRTCNTLLGHARDKLAFFRRCIAYLRFPPCRAMREGWTGWYADE
ncbi:endonuclease VII domain-containing protein [Streptomyces hydrogenans]|uniref:Recombination endonuclease VII n=1 Tax=Streptomyces hydrogenans TaxID=1873719 RepID=A0ABQ3PJE5_9ACTN|nr:endonuclease VII domain-containing protein [Streptomyces hydrogenans]GHF94432.1 hypothetical protein GCM10018784_02630 [Streptomyces hydrogenans]GHI25137.1 hypothetical protein Shyd_65080 [Streptomyces hydrogenans]